MLLRDALSRLREDVAAVRDRDPAAESVAEILLCYPGMHALWTYRVAHVLWVRGHRLLARVLATLARLVTGVDIHPAADVGRRCVIDHGTGVVIGATAEVGDDVHIFHGCTLGARTGSEGKRHPTVGDDVLLGANATVLGPLTIGDGASVGAAAVVLESVPAGETVVGNPARPVSDSERPGDAVDGGGTAGGELRTESGHRPCCHERSVPSD